MDICAKYISITVVASKKRIHAFSNDQEHPHDQRLLESVIKRETSVVGGKNPSLQILLFGTNPLNKQHTMGTICRI